jgi:uncharacterized membrane protein YgdD (TMEM256/DUF423 family)
VAAALGVLIPGEVIAGAVAVTNLFSTTENGQTHWVNLNLARALMLALGLLAIPILYAVGANGDVNRRGVGLIVLSMISFAGWLLLQPLTVYDSWVKVSPEATLGILLVAGIILGGLAALLGHQADT